MPPKASRGAILGSSIFAVRWVGRRRRVGRSSCLYPSKINWSHFNSLTDDGQSPFVCLAFAPLSSHLEFSVVGTLTASVSAVVLFCCTHRMLDNCSVVGVSMVGRRRSEWNRYPRCSTRFSASGEFSGGAPPFISGRREDGGGRWHRLGWHRLGCSWHSQSSRCRFSLYSFLRALFVPSARGTSTSRFFSVGFCRRSVSAPDPSAFLSAAAPTSLPRQHTQINKPF